MFVIDYRQWVRVALPTVCCSMDKALLGRGLIVSGTVRVWEHRRSQLEFESLPVYDTKGAVAVV